MWFRSENIYVAEANVFSKKLSLRGIYELLLNEDKRVFIVSFGLLIYLAFSQ